MRARPHPLRFPLIPLACALGLLACAPTARAAGFDPLPAHDLHPFALVHGVPADVGARLLAPGESRARVSLEAASHFLIQEKGDERLVLDGETHRLGVTYRMRAHTVEWGIEVPYVRHSSGFLDGLVEEWHEALGMPQSGRDALPRDRLRFFYARGSRALVDLRDATGGVGDVRLLAAWPLVQRERLATSLRASLKLPTGDAGRLLGSGAADLALSLAAGCGRCGARRGWHAHGGAILLGRGDVLREHQRSVAFFGGAGVGWRVLPAVVLKGELRARTPLYRDTAVRALDRTALQLILGGRWALGPDVLLDVAVTEDVRVETAPDVGFLLGLTARF
jgi:hypothetical protein